MELLESRLDNLIYKCGFTSTISSARQLINHGHILINNRKVTKPGYHCNISDKIEVNKNIIKKTNSLATFNINNNSLYLSIIPSERTFLVTILNNPDIQVINSSINILLVLEYYSGK